jgi:hypothetical protein
MISLRQHYHPLRIQRLSALLGLLIVVPMLLASCDNEAHLPFKKGDLEYNKKQVTVDQAQKIGAQLLNDSLFSNKKVTSAKLEKPDSSFVLSIVFDAKKISEEVRKEVNKMAMRYSENALAGATLDIVLTDSTWAPLTSFHYATLGKHLDVDGSFVFYTDAAGLDAVTALKNNLQEGGFFKEGAMVFRLDKNATGYIFQLFSTPLPRDEKEKDGLRESAKYWSTAVFHGTPVTFELCDLGMKPFLVLEPKPVQ